MSRPLLLGHRGARRAAPENTFVAFDQALAQGCDGFEFDVRRTADGRGLICHDSTVQGITIASASYSQISQRCISRRVPQILPCIEHVLERYAATAFLDIELKDPGLEEVVIAALREFPPRCGHVVSSFLPEAIISVRACDPQTPLGLICDRERQLQQWTALPVQFVMPHRSLVSRGLIEELHAAAKQVFVWTVNDKRTMLRLAEWGVDAIISDDTDLLCRTLARC